MPPPITTWRDALKEVDSNPMQLVSNNLLKQASGYILPDPGLFGGVNSSARQALYFYNWLKFRPALIFRLTNSSTIAHPNQIWRQMLSLSIDQSPCQSAASSTAPSAGPSSGAMLAPPPSSNLAGAESTKSLKYQTLVLEMLKDCLASDDSLCINGDTTDGSGVLWKDQPLSLQHVPSFPIAHEILWELSELNFRYEFTYLDNRAHVPSAIVAMESREDLLLSCFPGSIGRCMHVADANYADQGLAAERHQDRAPYLVALKTVMQTWVNFNQAIQACQGVDLHVVKDASEYSQTEVLALEAALACFYTQSFFNFFGRAAIIPRRLSRSRLG